MTANDNTGKPTIGWIGTGVMGGAMCGHILKQGYRVTISTRTKVKAQALLDQGALWADTPRGVGDRSDIVFTMVGFPDDVRQVYFGKDGLLPGAHSGQTFVDMTTTEPQLAKDIHAAARGKGVDVGARNATLSIMIGGDRPAIDRVQPLFELMGKRIMHQGGPGAGQHTKMSNQIVIAGTMIGVCESLLYAHKAGLSIQTMLDCIRGGAAACWALDNLAPRIAKRDFAPGFFVDHFIKDMGIALAEADRMNIALPGLALVHQLYTVVRAHGHGMRGTQALILALEEMSKTGPVAA